MTRRGVTSARSALPAQVCFVAGGVLGSVAVAMFAVGLVLTSWGS